MSAANASVTTHWPDTTYSGDDSFKIDASRLPPFNDSNFFNRAQSAAATWSAVSGSGFDFVYTNPQPSIVNTLSPTTAGVPNDHTWIADYYTGTCTATECWNWPTNGICPTGYKCRLGHNVNAFSNGEIYKALTVINHDDHIPWFQGTGAPTSSQYDLQSVQTHELGHAMGATGAGGSACVFNANMYTMCDERAYFLGNRYARDLAGHELTDLAAKY